MIPLPEATLNQLRDVVWRCTADGRLLLFINNAGCQVLGRTSEQLCHESPWWSDLIHPDDRTAFANHLKQVVTTPTNLTCRFLRGDGTFVTLSQQWQVDHEGRLVAIAFDARKKMPRKRCGKSKPVINHSLTACH